MVISGPDHGGKPYGSGAITVYFRTYALKRDESTTHADIIREETNAIVTLRTRLEVSLTKLNRILEDRVHYEKMPPP